MHPARVAAITALVCVCGCGGGRPPSTAAGRAVFASQCSSCHTLAHPRTPAPVGGDLANYQMTEAEVANFAKIMPTRKALSQREIDAVAAYVWSVQRRTR